MRMISLAKQKELMEKKAMYGAHVRGGLIQVGTETNEDYCGVLDEAERFNAIDLDGKGRGQQMKNFVCF